MVFRLTDYQEKNVKTVKDNEMELSVRFFDEYAEVTFNHFDTEVVSDLLDKSEILDLIENLENVCDELKDSIPGYYDN